MRCKICNVMLSDYESTFKYPGTNEYADECMSCYNDSFEDLGVFDDNLGKENDT